VFKVNFFCDDKKLADALRALAGLAAGIPEVLPVVNAVHKNGKVQAQSGSMEEQFARYAKANSLTKFKAADVTGFCKVAGFAPASRSYLIKQLVKSHIVKKSGAGTSTVYTVVS
jgi:hypothetical protein